MREQILLKERKQKNLVNNNISRKKELKKMLFNFLSVLYLFFKINKPILSIFSSSFKRIK